MYINVLDRILTRTLYRIQAIILFKKVGKSTYCKKPIRVINGNLITIGSNVSILHGFRIEAYDESSKAVNPIISIGDDTNIEQNVHITGGCRVSIGNECSLLSGCVITDINHEYSDVSIPSSKQSIKCKPVKIGDQCFIGTHAVILPGITLGNHVIVGANSVVTTDFPDNCVIAGIPARMIKRYDDSNDKWMTCD